MEASEEYKTRLIFSQVPFHLLRIPVSVYVQILIPKCAGYRNWKSDKSIMITGSLCFQTSIEKWGLKGLLIEP